MSGHLIINGWTERRLRELASLGLSHGQIGNVLGMSKKTVAYYRNKLDLPGPRRPTPTIPQESPLTWMRSGVMQRTLDFLTTLRPTLKAAADESPSPWQAKHRRDLLDECEMLVNLIAENAGRPIPRPADADVEAPAAPSRPGARRRQAA